MNTNYKYKFTPWWVTGFTQADGSFLVNFESRKEGVLPFRPRPYFVITQSKRELNIMIALHKYLGVGNMRYNQDTVDISVTSIPDLINVIIPHFDKYPLRGGKIISYLIFRTVVIVIKDGLHKSPAGFIQILDLAYFMHNTSKRTLDIKMNIQNSIISKFGSEVKNINEYPTLLIDFNSANLESDQKAGIHKDFVAGIFDGDGSINFTFKSGRRRITSMFTIIQDIHDYSIGRELKEFFKCGEYYKLSSEASRFQVESIKNLIKYIKPFFESVNLNTVKQTYLKSVFEAWDIINEEGIKSDTNLTRVVDLVYDINLEGKRRKINKEIYLNKNISSRSIPVMIKNSKE